MLTRQYCFTEGGGRLTPLPISAVIQAANRFCCEIYIRVEDGKLSVKDYNEFQRGMQPRREPPVFYFDGADEKEADVKFQMLFRD